MAFLVLLAVVALAVVATSANEELDGRIVVGLVGDSFTDSNAGTRSLIVVDAVADLAPASVTPAEAVSMAVADVAVDVDNDDVIFGVDEMSLC